jgi:delta 1-pyrroline-5-carboxylate dehydrogenase
MRYATESRAVRHTYAHDDRLPISLSQATTKLLIDGKFIESQTEEWLDVHNPATQEIVTRVPLTTQAEMHAAVTAASKAFKTWREQPVGVRARVMLKLQQLIRRDLVSRTTLLDRFYSLFRNARDRAPVD